MEFPAHTITPTGRIGMAVLSQSQASTTNEHDAYKKAFANLIANVDTAASISPGFVRALESRADYLERLRRPTPLEVVA